MNDEKLLKLLRGEPERGMKKLIERYGGLVNAVIRSKLSPSVFCSADAEDCAALTFAEFYFKIRNNEPLPGGAKAALCVMAKRNALDRLRKHYREAGQTPLTDAVLSSIPDADTPETVLVEAEDRARLTEAIRALGSPDSELIVRKYYLGQPSKEIAKQMNMSVSNVDTRTHRAIKKLQSSLGGKE